MKMNVSLLIMKNIMNTLLYKMQMKSLKNRFRFIIVGIAILLSSLVPISLKAEEIFKDLVDMKNVDSTFVSGRFASTKKIWRSKSGMHSMDLSQGFSAMYVYNCYSQTATDEARRLLNNYLKKNSDMEVMMRSKEAGGEYVLYQSFNKDNVLVKMIIWDSVGSNICEVVVVEWEKGLRGGEPYNDSNPKHSRGS